MQLIVYGPDGKTPIDPRTLSPEDQAELHKFAVFCAKSFLFKDGPREERRPEWATPIKSARESAPAPAAPAAAPAQAGLFPMEVREKKGAKRQLRSVAE